MTKQKFVTRNTFRNAFNGLAHAWVEIFNTFGVNPPLEPMSFIPQVLALENKHLDGALIKNILGLPPKRVTFADLRPHHAEDMKRQLLALHHQLEDAFVLVDGKWVASLTEAASYNESVQVPLIECPHCLASQDECEELHEKVGDGDIWRCYSCDRYFTAKPTLGWHISNSEWEYDDFLEVLGAYLDRLEDMGFDAIHIEGRNLNWRSAGGEHDFIIRDGAEELFRVLSIGNDFRLTFEGYLDGTAASWCSHHDANSAMDLVPGVTDDEGYFISHEGLEEAKQNALLVTILGDYDFKHVSNEWLEEWAKYSLEEFVGETAAELVNSIGIKSLTPESAELIFELAHEDAHD